MGGDGQVTYLHRKLSQRCVRSGCYAQCQDDHLLCETHAEDHRKRNRISMRQRRKWRRAQLGLWV